MLTWFQAGVLASFYNGIIPIPLKPAFQDWDEIEQFCDGLDWGREHLDTPEDNKEELAKVFD